MFDQYVAPSRKHADVIIPWARWVTPVFLPDDVCIAFVGCPDLLEGAKQYIHFERSDMEACHILWVQATVQKVNFLFAVMSIILMWPLCVRESSGAFSCLSGTSMIAWRPSRKVWYCVIDCDACNPSIGFALYTVLSLIELATCQKAISRPSIMATNVTCSSTPELFVCCAGLAFASSIRTTAISNPMIN